MFIIMEKGNGHDDCSPFCKTGMATSTMLGRHMHLHDTVMHLPEISPDLHIMQGSFKFSNMKYIHVMM